MSTDRLKKRLAEDPGFADAVAELIVNWYAKHRAAGGEADHVADDLIAETRAEDERGGGLSHQAGRA